jgi:putative transposase
VDRLFELVEIFAIDVVAYSVLSNHYHTILQVNTSQADSLSMDEVIERWTRLFSGHPLVALSKRGVAEYALLQKVSEFAEEWRERLKSVSWFMRCLNEHIARQARFRQFFAAFYILVRATDATSSITHNIACPF